MRENDTIELGCPHPPKSANAHASPCVSTALPQGCTHVRRALATSSERKCVRPVVWHSDTLVMKPLPSLQALDFAPEMLQLAGPQSHIFAADQAYMPHGFDTLAVGRAEDMDVFLDKFPLLHRTPPPPGLEFALRNGSSEAFLLSALHLKNVNLHFDSRFRAVIVPAKKRLAVA